MSSDPITTARAWVAAVLTDLTGIILVNQLRADAPRPAQPYAILHLEGSKAAGAQSPVIWTTDEDGVTYQDPDSTPPVLKRTIQRASWPRRGVLAVELVGAGSLSRAETLELSIGTPTVLAMFRTAEIALTLAAGATDSPDMRDTTWEQGASVAFGLRWIAVKETEVDVIDAAVAVATFTEET